MVPSAGDGWQGSGRAGAENGSVQGTNNLLSWGNKGPLRTRPQHLHRSWWHHWARNGPPGHSTLLAEQASPVYKNKELAPPEALGPRASPSTVRYPGGCPPTLRLCHSYFLGSQRAESRCPKPGHRQGRHLPWVKTAGLGGPCPGCRARHLPQGHLVGRGGHRLAPSEEAATPLPHLLSRKDP